MDSSEVRRHLVEALKLDLVGPEPPSLGDLKEILPQAPSRWYLSGFLVPRDAGEDQKAEEDSTEELAAEIGTGVEDGNEPEPADAKKKYLPSSMGLSVLVPQEVQILKVMVRWGDYTRTDPIPGETDRVTWHRTHCEKSVDVKVPNQRTKPTEVEVPGSDGLYVVSTVRPVQVNGNLKHLLPEGVKVVSVFVVNRRKPVKDFKDHAFAFQVQLVVSADEPFVARPNLQSFESNDWDERVADLQYRDRCEYAVGHNVSADAFLKDGDCTEVKTCWIPESEVERVIPATGIQGITCSMDELAEVTSAEEANAKLSGFVSSYLKWIDAQKAVLSTLPSRRKDVAAALLDDAKRAANRIESGIKLLADANCLDAFKLANKVMAQQARQRRGVMEGKDPSSIKPAWYPFQLAFLLMNLRSISEPIHEDREKVDLLFFPTGGGKTEAYLGLAAFTLALRRLRNPGIAGAGLTVLMRYTLRLLTLDQLSRAATMICALELERRKDEAKLGKWPFEIGLWVGLAATPNKMGRKGDNNPDCARQRTLRFKENKERYPSPIPLRECPWCGRDFDPNSFVLHKDEANPTDLFVQCSNRDCTFRSGNFLPIVAVDEPLYRRLPCFVIATVDKFAAMPWTGEVGAFFGRVDRYDEKLGFFGPCSQGGAKPIPGGRLLPPELIIQDELHLISGPLGTMAGLYECALDDLATHEVNGKSVRPKIIASTATVRRAAQQVQALFNRREVEMFPPPGPDLRNSFFARMVPTSDEHGRLYLGIAAQGRSPKLIMLRTYLALLSAGQLLWAKFQSDPSNPVDPYMTLLGYFNSLRELGGCRRVIEDEITNQLKGRKERKRVGEKEGVFANRTINYEPVELTSRLATATVANAKTDLAKPFAEKRHVDIAIATNMISVGLDITRLGLMVAFGQPKSSAEYIQATSRVGRDPNKPGLVVTLLNVHKPRDRSHYERFVAFHQSFYRSVEATSVTPFSPRAFDRGLAAAVVALARQKQLEMTPSEKALAILNLKEQLNKHAEYLGERAATHRSGMSKDEADRFRKRAKQEALKLLDIWLLLAQEHEEHGLRYQYHEAGKGQPLLHDFLDPALLELSPKFRRFRANRSMRDVEQSVALWVQSFDGKEVFVEDDK